MSVTEYSKEPYYWELYLTECKATNTKPSLKDYDVWVQELEEDRDENELS